MQRRRGQAMTEHILIFVAITIGLLVVINAFLYAVGTFYTNVISYVRLPLP
jgi:Flp pilus assembly pilin Flp